MYYAIISSSLAVFPLLHSFLELFLIHLKNKHVCILQTAP
ncbi:hypothetical protein FLA_2137 [Filimonas lacunae]|nr:hypothetical protein FLA_2137 [Filimonas lacunae]